MTQYDYEELLTKTDSIFWHAETQNTKKHSMYNHEFNNDKSHIICDAFLKLKRAKQKTTVFGR